MDMMEAKFRILEKNQSKALKAIKALAGKETIKDSSGKHYSWVETKNFVEARYIEEAMTAWRWCVTYDDSIEPNANDITDINFEGEKLGDDIILFEAIAPYVEAGSYIQMQGEDGLIWRWVFNGKTVKEVNAKLSFDQ